MVRNREGPPRPWGPVSGQVGRLDDLLQLLVQDQHQGPAHASQDVGPGALEEGLAALVLEDLLPAVDSARVHEVRSFVPRLHHHPSPHSVKGVGHHGHHPVNDHPVDEIWVFLGSGSMPLAVSYTLK